MSGPVIYANTQTGHISTTPFPSFSALSPSNVSEFSLNDCLGISEMFPSSSVSWDNYDTNSQEATTTGATTLTSTTPLTNTSSTTAYTAVTTPPSLVSVGSNQRQTTSPIYASSPTVANLVRSPSDPSPQSVTNFSQNQNYDNKLEDFSPSSGSSATHKLRNLLTHGIFSNEEPDSSPVIKKEPGLTNDNILRELLDQEDEGEMGSVANTPAAPASVNPPTTPSFEASGPGSVGSDKKPNNNNMLRMLLNDDDVGKRSEIRKNQDLVEQLLKDDNRDNNFISHFKKEPIDPTCNSNLFIIKSSIERIFREGLKCAKIIAIQLLFIN